MHDTALAGSLRPNPWPWMLLGGVVFAWGAGVLALATAGGFQQDPGQLPLRLMAGLAVPVLVGVLLWRLVPAIRAWTESWDLAVIVGLQTFRVLGILFLFFWWVGTLPGLFAWVGALGDIAVGILAIPTMLAVARRNAGWQGRVRWLTVAGLADFAAVLGVGILSQAGGLLHVPGGADTAVVQTMPLIMIPAFLVPMFILMLLLQWQRVRG
ncbi:MAG: hypothetical protein B7Z10_05205 [Rhodobacterales bacterium 32-66-7]|nr:MAG: hypothetical protein B7Z10_05205 [Rhodobacterales bacterium 32-66-7]